jgi:transcription elongation factor GreA
MSKKNIITKDGKKELQDELKKLIKIERPKVIEAIKEARSLGDLSENAEFDSARERQGQIEDRIQEIQTILDNSEIIKQKKSNENKVIIGSIVKYIDLSNKKINKIQLVGSLEADPFENKISNSSPLGNAILNATVGEKVLVYAEKKYNIQIKSIKSN